MQYLKIIQTLFIFQNGSSFLINTLPIKSVFSNPYIYKTQQKDFASYAISLYRPQFNLTKSFGYILKKISSY